MRAGTTIVEIRAAIVQSSYIPWRGYFDLIASADVCVLYDTVQFTKRDWRNRNVIKTTSGPQWLTIPVQTAGRFHQSVGDVRVSDGQWAALHFRSIGHAYARAPFFDRYRTMVAALYEEAALLEALSAINRLFIAAVAQELDIPTSIRLAEDLDPVGDRNERLVDLCEKLGASTYISGPSAKAYLDVALFQRHGIEVEFMDYHGYPAYPQLHGDFLPHVSVLDLLFNVGPSARRYLTRTAPLDGAASSVAP